MSNAPSIRFLDAEQMTDEEILATEALIARVWPKPDAPARGREEIVSHFRNRGHDEPGRTCVQIREGGELLANAITFSRTIRTEAGERTVTTLAAVCVDPERRGDGLGRAAVEAVFRSIDRGERPLALFQTGVPGFYEKLGCRVIDNRFVNRLAEDPEKRPWWDAHVMIYPAGAAWPSGVIDLNGPGY